MAQPPRLRGRRRQLARLRGRQPARLRGRRRQLAALAVDGPAPAGVFRRVARLRADLGAERVLVLVLRAGLLELAVGVADLTALREADRGRVVHEVLAGGARFDADALADLARELAVELGVRAEARVDAPVLVEEALREGVHGPAEALGLALDVVVAGGHAAREVVLHLDALGVGAGADARVRAGRERVARDLGQALVLELPELVVVAVEVVAHVELLAARRRLREGPLDVRDAVDDGRRALVARDGLVDALDDDALPRRHVLALAALLVAADGVAARVLLPGLVPLAEDELGVLAVVLLVVEVDRLRRRAQHARRERPGVVDRRRRAERLDGERARRVVGLGPRADETLDARDEGRHLRGEAGRVRRDARRRREVEHRAALDAVGAPLVDAADVGLDEPPPEGELGVARRERVEELSRLVRAVVELPVLHRAEHADADVRAPADVGRGARREAVDVQVREVGEARVLVGLVRRLPLEVGRRRARGLLEGVDAGRERGERDAVAVEVVVLVGGAAGLAEALLRSEDARRRRPRVRERPLAPARALVDADVRERVGLGEVDAVEAHELAGVGPRAAEEPRELRAHGAVERALVGRLHAAVGVRPRRQGRRVLAGRLLAPELALDDEHGHGVHVRRDDVDGPHEVAADAAGAADDPGRRVGRRLALVDAAGRVARAEGVERGAPRVDARVARARRLEVDDAAAWAGKG